MSQASRSKPERKLLRPNDRKVVAAMVAVGLTAVAVYWFAQGGGGRGMIDIDRAEPFSSQVVVDVNSAEWPELTLLPGIGENLARRIVENRHEQGRFTDLNDLQRVPGIGPKTLQRIKPYLLPIPDIETMVEDPAGSSVQNHHAG